MESSIDSHKLNLHPTRVADWIKKGDCYPLYIEIGPTSKCNHKCVFCALDWIDSRNEDIEKNSLLSCLKDMSKKGLKSVMFAGEGEPLLHKDTPFFIQSAKEYGLDVAITTNGVLFNKEKAELSLKHLSWTRFSVNAGKKETYAKIHKTSEKDFDKLIKNIKNSAILKQKNGYNVVLGVQCLMIPQNLEEIIELTKIVKDCGADNIQIKPYSYHPNSYNIFNLNPENYRGLKEKLQDFDSENFKVIFREATIKRKEEGITYSKCYALPFFGLITSKGDIIPCNLFYGNKNFTYGNIYNNSFAEIWGGNQRKSVIKNLDKKGTRQCREICRLDSMNRYLNRLINPEPHDKFI